MSGVYIKGMEMPKACIFCELYDHENYWCNAARKDVELRFDGKLCSFCPLVAVQDHGRLIDADALILNDKVNTFEAVFAIAEMPTIIPADKEDGE